MSPTLSDSLFSLYFQRLVASANIERVRPSSWFRLFRKRESNFSLGKKKDAFPLSYQLVESGGLYLCAFR